MATYSKVLLSASNDGRPIKVNTTGSPGTLIHTAVAGTTDIDEIYLMCNNTSASNVVVTVEWGGPTNPDDRIIQTIPPQSALYILIPGLCLNDTGPVRVFAATANVINVVGYVNRISA